MIESNPLCEAVLNALRHSPSQSLTFTQIREQLKRGEWELTPVMVYLRKTNRIICNRREWQLIGPPPPDKPLGGNSTSWRPRGGLTVGIWECKTCSRRLPLRTKHCTHCKAAAREAAIASGMQLCSKCRQPKPPSEFYRAAGRPSDLYGWCIPCCKADYAARQRRRDRTRAQACA